MPMKPSRCPLLPRSNRAVFGLVLCVLMTVHALMMRKRANAVTGAAAATIITTNSVYVGNGYADVELGPQANPYKQFAQSS